jgi:PAS domain S-box-containing protein
MPQINKKINRQLQGQISDGEEIYRNIFEQSPETIVVHDGEIVRLINPAGVKMLGVANAEELIGKPLRDFVRPVDHARIRTRFEQQRAGKTLPLTTEKLIRPDGTVLDVEIATAPYRYQSAPASLIFIRDITGRKQIEQALRESESSLRQAQHFARMGSWTWNMQTNQLDWSDEMYVIFGVDKETFSGALPDIIAQAIHPDDRAKVEQSNLNVIRGGKPESLEYRIVWKDGSIHIIQAEAAEMVRDKTGAPTFLRGTAQEITERKQAEQALRESEQRYKMVSELASDYIYKVGVAADGKISLDFVTDRFHTMTGRSLEDVRAVETWDKIIYPDDLGKFQEFLKRMSTTRQAGELECRSYNGYNQLRWLRIFARPEWDEQEDRATAIVGAIKDITARKQAEDALRESEENYRRLFDNAILGIFQSTPEDEVISVNRAFARMFGYDSPRDVMESIENAASNVFADPNRRTEIIRLMAENPDLRTFENVYRRKDGSTFIGNLHTTSIYDSNGRLIRIEGIIEDITERKQAEAALQETRSFLQQIVDTSPSMIFVVDGQGKVLFANQYIATYYGTTPEQFVSKSTQAVNRSQTEAQAYIDDDREVILRRQKIIREELNTAPNGEQHWFYTIKVPLFRPDGTVDVLGIATDITERKQAEQTLQHSEKRFRALIENSWDALVLVNAENKIIYYAPSNERVIGYTPEEVLGKHAREFIHPDDADAAARRLTTLREPGAAISAEYRIPHKNGSWIWVESVIHNLLAEPSVQAVVINMRNVTERREAQEKLRESEDRFRSLSQATFEGIMIHDQGVIQDANQAFAELCGYNKPEDLIGKNGLEVLSPTPESFERVRANVRTGSTEPLEICIVRPDGTTFPVETQAKEITLKGRKLRVVAMRDITKRKQAERTQARLIAILEATPDFVTIVDPGQHITYINRAARKMIGIGEDEGISGLKIKDLSPEWANEIIEKEGIPTAIRDGVWRNETARLARDGREIPVTQVILAHKEPDGTLEYLSSISRDITESKLAEEKIRRQLAHLTALSDIDRAIASSFDLKQSLTTLLGHVTRQLNVDAADALLFDPDTHTLKYIAGNGFRSRAVENFSMRVNQGYTGRVILERRMINVPNLQEQPGNFSRTALLAEDAFVSYVGVPLIAKEEVKGVLEIFHRTMLQPDEEWFDFLDALAEQAAIAVDNAILFSDLRNSKIKLEQAYDTTLDGWSRALDLRDRETEGHTRRVTEFTLQVARKFGFAEEELVQIKRGGLLHDIGKMGIPDAILLKPGSLTEDEWVIMRKHPAYAYEMLSPIEYLQPALDIPYCHHERWDGSGYPRGLKGEQIPLGARIFSIADVWDALNSDRPYRKAWERKKALEYVRSLTGTHFDPAVVNAFLEMTE